MKTLYFECNMGAAGDMIMASLLELHDNPNEFIDKINRVGIPGINVSASPSVKHGIKGTHIKVTINGKEESEDMYNHNHSHGHDHCDGHKEHIHHKLGEHGHGHGAQKYPHCSYYDIEHLIGHLDVSSTVKQHALGVYKLIAGAESHAHGVPVTQIHFHEVGEMDAVVDIISVCMLIEELAPRFIIVSPVHVGSGQVRSAHGVLPVPAPATAYILKDVPIYGGGIRGELCTPTGAAILKYFADSFGSMPIMKVSKIGYGMGTKDFESINCIRAFIGETGCNDEEVIELICTLDDMTPEAVAFAQQLLLDEGALDVFTTTIGMKKGRTGTLFTCMCKQNLRDKMLHLMFMHTTTLGIRENISRRYTLSRKIDEVQTQYGTIKIKTAQGYGITKCKPEYEDIAKTARGKGLPLERIIEAVRRSL